MKMRRAIWLLGFCGTILSHATEPQCWRQVLSRILSPSQLGSFERNQWVEYGDSRQAVPFKALFMTIDEQSFAIKHEEQTHFARGTALGLFEGVADNDHYLIRVGSTGNSSVIKVPKEFVRPTSAGNKRIVFEALKETRNIPHHFKEGQSVLFRSRNGDLEEGTVRKILRGGAQIAPASGGAPIAKSAHEIAPRLTKTRPRTFRMSASNHMEFSIEDAKGPYREFLNGGLRMGSDAAFRKLPIAEQLAILAAYTQRFFPWKESGQLHKRKDLIHDFNDVICTGATMCRHSAVAMSRILAEQGLNSRYTYIHAPVGGGHAWTEVDVPFGDTWRTFVVDTTSDKPTVLPLAEAERLARDHPQSFEAKYFTNSARKFIASQPIGE